MQAGLGQDDMNIRKLSSLDYLDNLFTRHELMVDGEAKFIFNVSDEIAKKNFNDMTGVKTQMKPFAYGGVTQEWIPLYEH
jgi:hypothetical protein